jgi:hypothetical protein
MHTKLKSENLNRRYHRGELGEDANMDFQELECDGVDWIHLIQNRVKWRSL